jgi:hypothetical protein
VQNLKAPADVPLYVFMAYCAGSGGKLLYKYVTRAACEDAGTRQLQDVLLRLGGKYLYKYVNCAEYRRTQALGNFKAYCSDSGANNFTNM